MLNSHFHFVLVDDHQQVRKALRQLIENNPLYRVVAEYGDGKKALEEAPGLKADVMIVDINMKPMNGFEVTESVLKVNPEMKIICLSVKNEPVYAKRMLALGAKGYITKSTPVEEIMQAVDEVCQGKTYICNEIRQKMER
jgi:DNA-binding NarL/FixJ family response regulator